jgi:hypothetical protein
MEGKNTFLGSPDRAVASAPAREAQNETDPMRTMWDALALAGCQPHGEVYKFRARCPIHGGTNTDALEVYEGVDRRVVFGCYAHGCDKTAIVDALGLRWANLFPAGHSKAAKQHPQRPVKPRPLSAGAAFIDSLTLAGYRWNAAVMLAECPFCAAEHCVLRVWDGVESEGGRFTVAVDCSDGCGADEVRRAVETRAAIAEKGLVL